MYKFGYEQNVEITIFSVSSDGQEKLVDGYYQICHNGIPTPDTTVFFVDGDKLKIQKDQDKDPDVWHIFCKAIYGEVLFLYTL